MASILVAAELRELLPENPAGPHTVEWLPGGAPTPAGPYPAVVPLLTRAMGEREFEGLPGLRIVANCAVGYDNVDLEAAVARGIVVTNTPEVLTESTADLTWALILAVARRLKEGQALIHDKQWTGWHPTQLLGLELCGSVLGIVGAGRIGQAVARRAVGFGMRILYTDQSPRPQLERATCAVRQDLSDLLAASDIVTLHLPSTPRTRGLFGEERLATMKPGAILVNTARGDIVRQEALLAALAAGRLAGAGLDVFENEPDVHPGLVSHPGVVTLPHIGSATTRTRQAMAELALGNVRAVLAGKPPLTPVSR